MLTNTKTESTPNNLMDLVGSINVIVSGSNKYAKFQKMYKNDRIAFVHDIMGNVGQSITFYQEMILGLFDDGYKRLAIRGPHGLGKTYMASVLTHHGVLTADEDSKIITTASAWRQLEKYLWVEIHKLAKHIDWERVGREPYNNNKELFNLSIRLPNQVEAFAVACDDAATIEGAHGKRLIYIFDEAKSIPRATWDAAEGAFSNAANMGIIPESLRAKLSNLDKESDLISIDYAGKLDEADINDAGNLILKFNPKLTEFDGMPGESTLDAMVATPAATNTCYDALAFAISTPGVSSGQFYDIHAGRPGYEDWLPVHVTLDDAIRAGRISAQWAAMRARQWGADSSIYKNRVLGEFSEDSDEGIIPKSWVMDAIIRWKEWVSMGRPARNIKRTIGIDSARMGNDKAVLAFRMDSILENLKVYAKLNTIKLANNIYDLADGRVLNIEMDGIGASIYDLLKDKGTPRLHPLISGGSTSWSDRSGKLQFLNVRAAMWWNMRDMLNPNFDPDICLPPIEELIQDLTTPMYDKTDKDVIRLESKKSIMSRLGRSTDYGDACCMAFWGGGSTGGGKVF